MSNSDTAEAFRTTVRAALQKEADTGPAGTRIKVLAALQGTGQPLDSYQVARITGLAPMTAGRVLAKLAKQGLARSVDELGTANDLAVRYALTTQTAAA